MRRLAIGLFALTAAGLTSCQDVGGNDSTPVTILLTDAAGDVLEAVVTISEIYLQGGDDETNPDGRVVLRSEPVTTDLLELENSVQTLVDELLVPSGTYAQLRFVIDGAYLKVDDPNGPLFYSTSEYAEAPPQVDGTLTCPSCSQSGIKVSVPGGIELDGTLATLIVDFDVADSFGHEVGQGTGWVMHPSLKAAKPAS